MHGAYFLQGGRSTDAGDSGRHQDWLIIAADLRHCRLKWGQKTKRGRKWTFTVLPEWRLLSSLHSNGR
jgi:hypothetical protein